MQKSLKYRLAVLNKDKSLFFINSKKKLEAKNFSPGSKIIFKKEGRILAMTYFEFHFVSLLPNQYDLHPKTLLYKIVQKNLPIFGKKSLKFYLKFC